MIVLFKFCINIKIWEKIKEIPTPEWISPELASNEFSSISPFVTLCHLRVSCQSKIFLRMLEDYEIAKSASCSSNIKPVKWV